MRKDPEKASRIETTNHKPEEHASTRKHELAKEKNPGRNLLARSPTNSYDQPRRDTPTYVEDDNQGYNDTRLGNKMDSVLGVYPSQPPKNPVTARNYTEHPATPRRH